MAILNRNIGKEFEKQMKDWFTIHPEIIHQWKENELSILHPTDRNKTSIFRYNASNIIIQTENKTKQVKKNYFQMYLN